MLTARQAARLARRAQRRRADGGRRLLARRAWRRLAAAAPSEHTAARAVFRVWQDSPDDESWNCLAQMPDRDQLALASAVQPELSAGSRAAIGAFCAAHALAPEEPAARVLFYVLTGQSAQQRAADPDGSALRAAYEVADEATRAVVRESLAGSGDTDLVRVVAGAPQQRRVPITAEEARYLAGQLTARGDWAGLWRLVLGLPLQQAVETAARFPAEWQPADDAGRGLLRRLAMASPEEIARARAMLGPLSIEVDGFITAGSVSADGRSLVVAVDSAHGRAEFRVYKLPAGEITQTFSLRLGRMSRPNFVRHLGRGFLIGWSDFGATRLTDKVILYSGGQADVIWQGPRADVALHPAGFVMLRWSRQLTNHLRLCDASGTQLWDRPLSSVGLADRSHRLWRLAAADPASGRVAVYLGNLKLQVLEVSASQARVILPRPITTNECSGCFTAPDRLVLASEYDISLYSLSSRGAERMAEVSLQGNGRSHVGPPPVVPIADRGAIAVRHGEDEIAVLDAQTLQPAEGTFLLPLGPVRGRDLWSSPDGRCLALASHRGIYVEPHPLSPAMRPRGTWPHERREEAALTPVCDRPPASLTLADAEVVVAALRITPTDSPAWPLLDLLAARLDYRFGAEVALGASGPVHAAADDVTLAEPQ
jgi:hypothetical protein